MSHQHGAAAAATRDPAHAGHDHGGHDHGSGGHSHGPGGHVHGAGAGNERRVFWAMLLTGGFMLAEVAGGIVSGSLALLADAGHMLTDAAGLGLAFYAFRVSRLAPHAARTYGNHRIQVLAAFINGAALLGITAWIGVEAVQRLFQPVEVLGGTMFVIALLGLAVNIVCFLILHGGEQENLNVRGATLHVLGDLLGSVGALVAGGVILLTGWTPIDPLLSFLVAALIVRSALQLLARSWHVLMEGTPEGLDLERLPGELATAVPGVVDVHHVHAWSLTPERAMVTLHATIDEAADHDSVLRGLQGTLADRFALRHATIQLERRHCTDDERRPC